MAKTGVDLTEEVKGILPVANGGTNASSVTIAPTASAWAGWDASKNLSGNVLLEGFTTQVASSTTLTLTIASAQIQVVTTSGTQTQLITLPTTSVPAGGMWTIINLSNALVTVQSSGANTITILAPNGAAHFKALVATPTTATNWVATFLGQRISKRVVTVNAPGATPSINTDVTDIAIFTGVAAAITSMTTNLTGTPQDGDQLLIRFTDNATARAITWGAKFGSSGVATLLATTVISKVHNVFLVWDATKALWICMAVDATGY
jgi:hypothetical protein